MIGIAVLALLQAKGLDSDYGPALAFTLARAKTDKDADVIAHKALNLRLDHDVSAAFDTDSCRFVLVWTGGFLDLSGTLLAMNDDSASARIRGTPLFSLPPGPRTRFLGFERRGRRVTLRYVLDGVEIHDSPRAPAPGVFVRDLKLGPGAVDLPVGPLVDGARDGVLRVPADAPRVFTLVAPRAAAAGPDLPPAPGPLWTSVRAPVTSSVHGPFTMDSFAVPDDNPWKAWIRPTAVDVLPDGRVALASLNGDVFLVKDGEWRRFAAGLNQPLGLKVVDGLIHVRGRDQITRLRDVDGDGEADAYDCFNNDGAALANYQDFAFDLETDAEGRFYWSRNGNAVGVRDDHGCVFRTSKDGSKSEVFATGFRAPCGMSIGPDGTITASDQQGQWVPASKISVVRQGAYYGHGGRATAYEAPLCWLPQAVDNSSGGQAWVPADAWGPLGGALLHFSYGTSSLFHVLRDGAQAAVVKLPIPFPSGVIRGRFHGQDLYAVGLRGWQTNAVKDAGLWRIRWTGGELKSPIAWKVEKDAMLLTFAAPMEVDADAFDLKGWNYRGSEAYGSDEWSVRDPKKKGRDTFEIASVRREGSRLRLEIPGMRPMMQFHLRGRAEGFSLDLYGTVRELPR